MKKVLHEPAERREYNSHLRRLQAAARSVTPDELEGLLIKFDEKWCPEVVERRKQECLYIEWAFDRLV